MAEPGKSRIFANRSFPKQIDHIMIVKKFFWIVLLFAGFSFSGIQAQEKYDFTEISRVDATEVKSQDKTGTCWAFSTASFLESEALRMGKGKHNLSEMFVVRNIYRQKCENYVRRQGKANLSQGALAHDLLNVVYQYGIVPEAVYPGRQDPSKPFNHSKIERDLIQLCDGFIEKAKKRELRADWLTAVDSLLDLEFGKLPIQFDYKGSIFSPISFRDYLGINTEDYINLTSFTHHPFWTQFILEIPDNFSNGSFYNIPINELMRSLDNAIQSGYSVEWDGDVSNRGFSAQNGIAIVPAVDWADKTEAQRAAAFEYWESEVNVSQNYRQELFDKQVTTDDHLMHVTGMLDESHSGNFYAIKNSWGEISDLKGYLYASDNYMRLNTVSITVHRDAIPKDIQSRLGLVKETSDSDVREPRSLDGSIMITPNPPKFQKPAPGVKSNSKSRKN